MKRRHLGVIAALAASSARWFAPSVAEADEEAHRRYIGVGTVLGGGYGDGISMLGLEAGGFPHNDIPIRFAPQQGDADALTLKLQFFTKRGYSVDISIPATKMMLPFLGAWVVNTDFYFNFNVGRGIPRLVVGPGLGYTVTSDGSRTGGAIRFPSEIGLELLTKGHGFGFKVMARPYWEVVFDTVGTVPGAGCIAAIAFTGYAHR